MLFVLSNASAQTINVIDNKGTIQQVDPSITNEIQDLDLNLTTHILTITENGTATAIDLNPYLDNTDNQQITAFSLAPTTNILTLTLQDGGTMTVDLSALDDPGSDDQTVDTFSLNADGIHVDLSLEDDAAAPVQADLSGLLINGDVTGNLSASTVEKIQGTAVSNTAPANEQLFIYNGANSQWEPTNNPGWLLSGNSGTDSNTQFLGTTDNQELVVRTDDTQRALFGSGTSNFTNLRVSGPQDATTYSGFVNALSLDLNLGQDGQSGQAVTVNGALNGVSNQFILKSGSSVTGGLNLYSNRIWSVNGGSAISTARGFYMDHQLEGANADITDLAFLEMNFRNQRLGGSLTNYYGLRHRFLNPTNMNTTNFYGVWNDSHTNGDIANYYGFWQGDLGTGANRYAFFYDGDDSSTQDVVITGSGAIGVGTTTPSKDLDINGEARIRTLPIGALSNGLVSADADGNLTTFPTGTSGQVLTSDGAGNYVWSSLAADDNQTVDSFALNADGVNLDISLEDDGQAPVQADLSGLQIAGDITGTLAATTVEKIQGTAVSATAPTQGQLLLFNGTEWEPSSIHAVAEIYDATGTQTISEGSFSDITFASSGIVDTADYTVSSTTITIINPGRYEVTYRASTADNVNNRTGGEFYLDVNGTEAPGTRAYTYSRNRLVGNNTASVTKVIAVTAANTVVKVRGQVYASSQGGTSATALLAANGSSLLVKRLR